MEFPDMVGHILEHSYYQIADHLQRQKWLPQKYALPVKTNQSQNLAEEEDQKETRQALHLEFDH